MKNIPQSYFRHDANASNDLRLLKVEAKYGIAGIGMFWRLAETLYLNDGYMDADAMQTLCKRSAIASDYLDFCKNIGLFVEEDGKIFSRRILSEIGNRMEKSKKAQKAARKMWQNKGQKPRNANAEQTHMREQSKSKAFAMLGEERRGEEINIKKPTKKTGLNIQNAPPTKRVEVSTPSSKQVDDSTPKRQYKTDDETEQEFFETAIAEGWCEHTYADSKRAQLHELRTNNRDEVFRKMRVCLNSLRSKGETTRLLAKKMYGEIVGRIQDSALDERTIDGKEIAKRNEFAKQEYGRIQDVGEVGAVGNVEWE